MFPTTCVTFPPTSLPPTRKSVSSLFTEENVTPGFVLPAQGPLNLLCKRSGGDAHAGTQPRPTANGAGCSERSGSCTLHLCPAPVTSITRLGHQGPSPSKHFTSRRALAFGPQMLVGASPPQESLCGSCAEPLLLWQTPTKAGEQRGTISMRYFFLAQGHLSLATSALGSQLLCYHCSRGMQVHHSLLLFYHFAPGDLERKEFLSTNGRTLRKYLFCAAVRAVPKCCLLQAFYCSHSCTTKRRIHPHCLKQLQGVPVRAWEPVTALGGGERKSRGLGLMYGQTHVIMTRHSGLAFNLLCFKWEICEDQISSNPGQISLKIFDLYKQENEV